VNAVVGAFLLTFAGLFPIVNPLEGAPFFLGLTANLTAAERTVLARKAAVNGFALLLGSMALGPWLLEFFGIELPVVRIAGGLVVAALGWKLLTQEQWSDHAGSGLQGAPGKKVGSFYPLTMPLTVGPGSMSVAITIGSRKPAGLPQLSQLAEHAT
jgi:multiple antibiotic resistance protein